MELLDKSLFKTINDHFDYYAKSMTFNFDNKIVQINIPKNVQHDLKSVETIGMWMSGGADSSMLAWCLAKFIKDNNLDIKIQPLSVRRGRPNNPIYAGNVIDFIEEDLNFKFNDHIVYYPPKDDPHQMEIQEFMDRDEENFNTNLIQIMYSGITCNPPENDTSISKNKERKRDESSIKPYFLEFHSGAFINPWSNVNKRYLAKIYDYFNLTDKLFPLTYSCEGTVKDTNTHTQHCGKCWWCEERMWAFGRLI